MVGGRIAAGWQCPPLAVCVSPASRRAAAVASDNVRLACVASVINLDAKVSDGRLQLGMAQQQLGGAKVLGSDAKRPGVLELERSLLPDDLAFASRHAMSVAACGAHDGLPSS